MSGRYRPSIIITCDAAYADPGRARSRVRPPRRAARPGGRAPRGRGRRGHRAGQRDQVRPSIAGLRHASVEVLAGFGHDRRRREGAAERTARRGTGAGSPRCSTMAPTIRSVADHAQFVVHGLHHLLEDRLAAQHASGAGRPSEPPIPNGAGVEPGQVLVQPEHMAQLLLDSREHARPRTGPSTTAEPNPGRPGSTRTVRGRTVGRASVTSKRRASSSRKIGGSPAIPWETRCATGRPAPLPGLERERDGDGGRYRRTSQASGSLTIDWTTGGSVPLARSARVTRSSTARRLARTAIHTSRRGTAAPW